MSDSDTSLAIIGTYTDSTSDGVYSMQFDRSTESLEIIDSTEDQENPSFVALNAADNRVYTVNEVDDGGVTTFAFDQTNGSFSRIQRASTHCAGPCFICLDPDARFAFVANYSGGCVSVLPIDDDGVAQDAEQVIEHEGSGPNGTRQEAPHPHSAFPDPEGNFVYVPDLGTDEVVIYAFDPAAKHPLSRVGTQSVAPGAGPRHLDFHPKKPFVYLINELDSTIDVFTRNLQTGELTPQQSVSTLPVDNTVESTTAEIRVHPTGNWVYGSNRGHDSITTFSIDQDNGKITSLDHTLSGGRTPRNFTIGPEGSYLFAANQESDLITVFRISPDDGTLHETELCLDIPVPVCIRFIS